MDDQAVIALYWARDPQAVQETERAYGNRLTALAFRILGSPEDAEEAVSDTYLAAWNSIPPQRPSALFPYLAKICRNAAFGKLDWLNAKKRKAEVVALTQEMEECIPDRSAAASLERASLGRLMNRFVAGLDRESRKIFLRRYWFADSVREIAQSLGISESKVKIRLHRTRKKLRDYLEREGITV